MSDAFQPSPEAPGRIMVVDGQPGNLRMLSLELRRYPFDLRLVESAQEALKLAERVSFEGILMDVSLPEIDGLEVCRRIRAGTLNAQTPLIFLSAVRVGEEWVSQGLEAGGMDYLTKPYAFGELLAKLRMMVRLTRQQRTFMQGERQRALLEVAGGAAHELSQPLASAQLLMDQLQRQKTPPTAEQLRQLSDFLDQTSRILHRIQNVRTYVTKPYMEGTILDIEMSSQPTQPIPIYKPSPKK
jgi:two-component system, sensor histidine kinase and response regulator